MRTATAALAAALLVTSAAAVATAHPQQARDHVNIAPTVAGTPRKGDSRVFLDHADILYKEQYDSFMIVTGNVQFTRDAMVMNCDSAHFYPESESFDAFGNVRMEQGDTLYIYADELNYRAPEKLAFLYGSPGRPVRMINRDVTLETDEFIYDIGAEVGYYNTGGVLFDSQNRLSSREGEYLPPTKDANFYVDVHLVSLDKKDTLNIYSDSLFYNTLSKMAELKSPSEIINRRGTIYTSDGFYDTNADTAALYRRSTMHTPEGRTLTADTIYYDHAGGSTRCYGSMLMTDSVRQASMAADYGFFNQATDSGYATGRLLIKEYSKEDTLYLHGRQINGYRVIDSIIHRAVPADTVTGAEAIAEYVTYDTTNVADIWPRVRFYRSDMQGICDSMRVTGADTTLRMYVNPVIWSDQQQIFGNEIHIHLNDSTIDNVLLPNFGFASQQLVDDYYNQLSGKQMKAWFEGGELKRVDINGNVEILMYPQEQDSTINKMVTATSSFLTATFKGQTTEYIKMWPGTDGNATPLYLMRRSMLFLPKFKLFKGIRPLSPSDVMIIPKAMDDLMEGENDG